MRPTPNERVERFRVAGHRTNGNNGHFMIDCPATRTILAVIASDGAGWEHVSVHVHGVARCPNWTEMGWVKDLFWEREEAVMQLHPPESQYRNIHPYVLHLWRPLLIEIPLPPLMLV